PRPGPWGRRPAASSPRDERDDDAGSEPLRRREAGDPRHLGAEELRAEAVAAIREQHQREQLAGRAVPGEVDQAEDPQAGGEDRLEQRERQDALVAAGVADAERRAYAVAAPAEETAGAQDH